MPFPNLELGFETFFEATRILLFGKPFLSLTYNRESMSGVGATPGDGGKVGGGFDPAHADEFTPYDTSATPTGTDDSQMPPKRIERTLRKQRYVKDSAGNLVPVRRFLPNL